MLESVPVSVLRGGHKRGFFPAWIKPADTDLMLLNRLLRLILDHNLADYITVKNNTILLARTWRI